MNQDSSKESFGEGASVATELLSLINFVRVGRDLRPLRLPEVNGDLRRDLGFDSLDLAELTVRIQDKFGVDVFAAGVVRTWGELLERVEAYVARISRP
jgi:acyl carrier protein